MSIATPTKICLRRFQNCVIRLPTNKALARASTNAFDYASGKAARKTIF
jgi:hypothetical protein